MALETNGSRSATLRRPASRRELVGRRQPPRRQERQLLDQAIAINGELSIQLFGLNLLPIKVRLLISSKDVAAELGLDWWRKHGPATPGRDGANRPRQPRNRAARDL